MKRDVDFLYEIGVLRFTHRHWERFLMPNPQNVTEHHFRVVWIALVIAAREGVKNTDKIMKMALVHDITESRTNDVDYISRQYVKRDEEKAINDILDDTSVREEFLQVWKEYEARESIEAKIVKDADNLDVDMELREVAARGSNLEETWKHRESLAATNFFTETARQMYKEIKAASPHDWHVNSPHNRTRGGDWKGKVKK